MIHAIIWGDLRDHCFLQFEPLHEQMLAVQVHVPVVSHEMLHTSPEHEHVLESVHANMQPPFGFWQLASQSSVPLQV